MIRYPTSIRGRRAARGASRLLRWLRLLALAGGAALILIRRRRPGPAVRAPEEPQASLERRIRQRLTALGPAADRIEVTVAPGVVTLTGIVVDAATAAAAENAARTELGPGDTLVNAITIEQPGD